MPWSPDEVDLPLLEKEIEQAGKSSTRTNEGQNLTYRNKTRYAKCHDRARGPNAQSNLQISADAN